MCVIVVLDVLTGVGNELLRLEFMVKVVAVGKSSSSRSKIEISLFS